MVPVEKLALLEEILDTWRGQIGGDFTAYRNHVYRMANFCFALRDCNGDDRDKIAIAGAFHDIGIWSDGTFDYLPPSVRRARDYLQATGREAWAAEIELMIDMHHKLKAYTDERYPLVEVFRKADLVDVSLGLVTFGVPRRFIRAVKKAFPNTGFHKRLVQLTGGWLAKHPVSPPPFFKW